MSDREQKGKGSNSTEQGSSNGELDNALSMNGADWIREYEEEAKVTELANKFTYHPPKNDTQLMTYAQIREAGRKFAMLLVTATPDTRERSLALTKIEEAVMWGNAGVARNT
jgi:hypothetical protein